MPKAVNSVSRSEMIQEIVNSSRTRRTIATDRPMRRAAACWFFGRCWETMAMKTILSMPSTISSTTRVAKLIHAFGSVRSSSIGTRCQSQLGDRSGNTQQKRLTRRNDPDGGAHHDIGQEMRGQHRASQRETERQHEP